MLLRPFWEGSMCIYDKIINSVKMEKLRSFPLVFNYGANKVLKAKDIDESWLFHLRLGQLNVHSLKILRKKEVGPMVGVYWEKIGYSWGLRSSRVSATTICQRGCFESKLSSPISTHTNVYGPMRLLLILIIDIPFSSLLIRQE